MLDLAPITRHLRAKATSHLLVAAVHYFNVFEELSKGPLSIEQLMSKLALKKRPAMVLFPALCAMGLIQYNSEGKLQLTETGRFLTLENSCNLIGYVELEKEDPSLAKVVEWLKNDGPKNASQGVSYVKDEKAPSPMDEPDSARFYTMALAGRAKYISPVVASKITKGKGVLLDIAAGTGYYTYEWLLVNPSSHAIVFDRPEVLKVASEILNDFCRSHGISFDAFQQRITFMPGDMLTDKLPEADIILAASLFHDWPVEICERLAVKFAGALKPGGELWIHDAFLNDTLDGPLPVTDYSAMLFLGTKGRLYSRKEYKAWLSNAGLIPTNLEIPTLMDYGLISAIKPL